MDPRLDGVVTKKRRRVNVTTQSFDSWGMTAAVLVVLAQVVGVQRIADACGLARSTVALYTKLVPIHDGIDFNVAFGGCYCSLTPLFPLIWRSPREIPPPDF